MRLEGTLEQLVEAGGAETEIRPASVCLGPTLLHQSGAFEHAEMVGEQVGGDPQVALEVGGRDVADAECINDPEPGRVGQRGVQLHAAGEARIALRNSLSRH